MARNYNAARLHRVLEDIVRTPGANLPTIPHEPANHLRSVGFRCHSMRKYIRIGQQTVEYNRPALFDGSLQGMARTVPPNPVRPMRS